MKTYQQFLNDLGMRESSGDYTAFNKYGYLGKYQMGEMALVDCGYYKKDNKKYNNDWSGEFLGKDGIYSIQDFLNNKQAQENAQKIFKKKQWTYLKSAGADKYCGNFINGFEITPSALLAAAHLKGVGPVLEYLKSNGQENSKDAFGTSVENYMRNFTNYDVSEIIN